MQNNQKYFLSFENNQFYWERIDVPTKYMGFRGITNSLDNNRVLIGYRYFAPTEKPLDLVRYIEIIKFKIKA